MCEANGIIERSDFILGELEALGLTLARDLHRRALETEDADQAARLAMAFHHISRSVRQSLALQAKLDRDRKLVEVQIRDDAERRETASRDRRKAQVRAAVQRLAWTERPDWNLFAARDKLDLILDAEAEDETFPLVPLETLIARIAKALGLKAPPQPAEPAHRSSA